MSGTTRRTIGFWLLAATQVLFFAASSAPSPLYLVYQQKWHFSSFTLTLVFASYAGALLLTLLTVGGLSDFVGRRRVLAVSLVIEVVAMVAFLTADGVWWLLAARVVQGVATGIAAGALGAAVADLAPVGRPTLAPAVNTAAPATGLAVGALTSGVLVEYAPDPRVLVFAVFAVAFVALLAALLLVPETVEPRAGALSSLRPRVAVPVAARSAFRIAAPVLIATWAVGGLVLSLGPSLAAGVFGLENHLVGGLVVTAVAGVSAVGSVVTRSGDSQHVMRQGSAVLFVGIAIFLIALATTSTPVFFAGLVVSGWGFGAAFVGAFGSVAGLVAASQRAELFASLFVVSYLAFGGSAVLAGLAVPRYGLQETATWYAVAVMVLALVAAVVRPAPVRAASPEPLVARPDRGTGTSPSHVTCSHQTSASSMSASETA
jgi:MFS family permease